MKLFCISISLLLAAALGATELPNPGCDPESGLDGWERHGDVVLDAQRGAAAPGALRLTVSPQRESARIQTAAELALKSWHWYRLSFACRLEPGAQLTLGRNETDAEGVIHHRLQALDVAPTDGFEVVELRFISWPEGRDFTLSLRAGLVDGMTRPARVWIDDLRLEALGPAPVAPARRFEGAIHNGDFETAHFEGHASHYRGGELTLVTADDACEGRRYLRHAAGPNGDSATHWYAPVLDDVELEYGHMYRLTMCIRGPGSAAPGIHVGYWMRDRSSGHPPRQPEQWQQVRRDFIIDQRRLRDWRCIVGIGGQVDIDNIRLERLR